LVYHWQIHPKLNEKTTVPKPTPPTTHPQMETKSDTQDIPLAIAGITLLLGFIAWWRIK
jgi:hypothetical protein